MIMDMQERKIIIDLTNTVRWSKEGAEILIRSGYKCEYCGLDFFANVTNYRLWHVDHIIPKKHAGLNSFNNYAASCHPCNSVYKNQWDPRKDAGQSATRDELIAATRAHIAIERKKDEKILEEERLIIGWGNHD